ncbi:hypothetical protein ND856_18865 [Leptospira bandrabouensis]|uniref:hypothetical protein n=1 Tax=Leptospira bandrabouensis TaxID=2484903 RepID=UPI00223E2116|nr:hypothetical protein [Leptospira bandrabouensis]MCW7479369.1 hypothetical protein [Leptospira bandrabouensis]MCW7487051.1 hypothetical protein [Leptospira bandrabouensis]
MDTVDFNELEDLFLDDDSKPLTEIEKKLTLRRIKKSVKYDSFSKYSVLGIDILDYSQFPEPQQIFVPKILDKILETAFNDILEFEDYLFQNEIKTYSIRNSFIDQGDGGFYILETPLHSIILALYIESALRRFNSFNLMSKIRSIVGPLKLRYSITYDTLYRYEGKWTGDNGKFYGPAIIHCARIMSKDKLDRCLIDESSYLWFLEKMQGIESLKIIPFEHIKLLFPNYLAQYAPKEKSGEIGSFKSFTLRDSQSEKESHIESVDILKIGQISVKKDKLNIYNLHMQMSFSHTLDESDPHSWKYYLISLGNLNPEGLISN